MELKRLKHLVALADTRNFGRAAELCHLSQSAFSRSILAAEAELGLQLFDRGTIEARCTDAGRFVIERARQLTFDARCLERDVQLYRERQIGDVAFGVGPYPANTLLAGLLAQLREQHPGVNAKVEVNNAHYLSEHLRSEELDFFVGERRSTPDDPDLCFEGIGRQYAGFYVRAAHPLAHKPALRLSQLLPYGIASVRIPDSLALELGQILNPAGGQRLTLAIECDDLNVLKAVACNTQTVLACNDAGARLEVARGELVRLQLIDVPPLFAEMGIVSLKGRSLSPMAMFAAKYLADQGASPPG